jgi:hypothetical protein
VGQSVSECAVLATEQYIKRYDRGRKIRKRRGRKIRRRRSGRRKKNKKKRKTRRRRRRKKKKKAECELHCAVL